ncbi:MAG TPA: hypoxanthine phosphoribosyltransferase [Anaeromyxobacteraceae bacterium]|nr:hypoxanthine phosphoribosyltransferase [Anaeromyxobacteraceae bacterium]
MSNLAATVDVLISEEQIRERVAALGREITRDYAGRPLVVVGVLKGSFIFFADLVRAIDLPLSVDFIGISSYQGTHSTGVVQITSDLTRPVEGVDVLLVEDIVDTGLTMKYLLANLGTRRPASVRICALLEKPARARVQVPIAYKGFVIDDVFVVGYGLDWDGKLRNLPFVGVPRK